MSDQLSTDLAALRIDRAPRRSARGGIVRVRVTLGVLGALGGAMALGYPLLEAKLFKTEVEVTEIALVSPAQASIELTSTGYVIPQSVSQAGAKIGGKVSKVLIKQGVKVAAGDVLFEIDPIDHKATMAAAQSQAAAAKARATATRANMAELEQQLTRARALAKEGVGPQSAADDLAARLGALKEQTNAAEAETRAAGAQVGALRVNLDAFTVRAPISGTVLNKPPELGEFVGPQPAGVSVDMGGVEIADFDSLMVETDVPEQRLSLIKLGGPCEIVLDAYPTRRYRGKALEVTPKIDRAKATVTVKVAFVDEKDGALPEMSARVSFLSKEVDQQAIQAPPKVIVPGSALTTVNGARVVYALEDGKARLRPVTLGPAFGSGFELKSGPSPGTRLIKQPPADLADGQPVKERTKG